MPTIKVTKVEFVGRVKEREVIVEEENVVPWGQEAALHVVGRATPRVDGVARVTGQAVYTHDVQLPGMLIGRFLRSPYPHARLKRIDSSVAEELPGVWVVWHRGKRPPVDRLDGREVFLEELAYQGAEVAFVAAQDERIAEDALRLIEVEYEELPFAPDLPSATAEDAPLVLAGSDGNVIDPEGQVYERGSVGGGSPRGRGHRRGDVHHSDRRSLPHGDARQCGPLGGRSAHGLEFDPEHLWHPQQHRRGAGHPL